MSFLTKLYKSTAPSALYTNLWSHYQKYTLRFSCLRFFLIEWNRMDKYCVHFLYKNCWVFIFFFAKWRKFYGTYPQRWHRSKPYHWNIYSPPLLRNRSRDDRSGRWLVSRKESLNIRHRFPPLCWLARRGHQRAWWFRKRLCWKNNRTRSTGKWSF